MDKKYQNVLQQMRQNIIDDLDVYNGIIIPLTTEYILKEEDVDDIKKGKTRQERAEILLDLLPKCGSHAFEVFHQSLRHQYYWLSDEIDKMLDTTMAGATTINDISTVYPNLQPVSPLTVTREEMVRISNLFHLYTKITNYLTLLLKRLLLSALPLYLDNGNNDKLKNTLSDLQPNGYVALHGMKGFGKSCLTASALKDKDFTLRLFNNEIYWLKFGYKRKIEEEILIQLNNLYHQIKNLNDIVEPVNSEPLEKILKQSIENHFRKGDHSKALLILDDVCHKEIVDKFDFSCKILVITPDLGVLNKRSHTVVKMDHGFTESETLGLFAKVLDCTIDQLPIEAKLIHEECKGMPLLIAMFAAQFENFKHDMKRNKGRWEYYLNCLRTKNAKNKVIEEFMKIQEATFDMCINQLNDEMKERYTNLAIFSEDVNITPKTLEILWSEEAYYVDDQMLDFCHKSLAAKKWNDDLHCYIYGVHDLLLCHLKKKLTETQLRDKHRLFIEKYRKYCGGDFSKLPDDNYSFSYIGHHLEQAEMYEEFTDIYLNFDFLQAKINQTGLSDLFIDLKKYRKHITKSGNENLESNLKDIEQFLEIHANTLAKHRLMKCLDLVQIAMEYPNEGFVKHTARRLALFRSFSLYLSHQTNEITNPYLNFCEEVISNASTVAFTNEPSHILVGSDNGEITLWDCENRKPQIFCGHNKKYPIKKIVLSISGDRFLALSGDGSLKLFELNEDDYKSGLSIPAQSPRHKQSFWKGFYDTKHDDSIKSLEVCNEFIIDMKFAQKSNSIAACTSRGTLILWDSRGNFVWKDEYKQHRFGGVTFSTNDQLLHVMDETISVVRIYRKNQDCGYTYISQFNLQLNDPRVIYFSKHPLEENCLVIVTEKTALYFKWFFHIGEHISSYDKHIKTEEKDKNTWYTAATLTYDARYLIIANSKGIISVMKAFNPDHLITYFKGHVTALDSYFMDYEDLHLICGSEKTWIHRWQIKSDEQPKSVKKMLFDAKVGKLGASSTVFLKTSQNSISVYNGKGNIGKIDSQHGKIVSMKLYDDANRLIYTTESGSVVIHDLIADKSTLLSKLDSIDSFIDVLQLEESYVVMCKAENNKLQVWRNIRAWQTVEGVDNVISIHKITENCVMTISNNGKIKYWIIDTKWQGFFEFIDDDGTIIYSCLSECKLYLALLKDEQHVAIYSLPNIQLEQPDLKMELWMKYYYKHPLHICKFSHDNKYLAIALEGGDISIIDLQSLLELERLSLHSSTVGQLYWSPITINVPVILSMNCDEVAWWNVSFLKNPDKSQNRRSRMGLNRSTSSPTVGISPRSSYKLPNSQSAELTVLKEEIIAPKLSVDDFWSRKLAKGGNSSRPALLGCIQLPSSCTGNCKVCISDDFSQFLTVDIHGTVSSYTLFGIF